MCKYRRYFYGWSGGRKVWPKEYAEEKKAVLSIIQRNREQESIVYAVTLIERWLKNGRGLVAGLRDQEVGAEEVLIEAGAIYCFMMKHPGIIKGWTALRYSMGLNVIRLHKASRRVYGRDSVTVGGFLVKNLKPLLGRIYEAYLKSQEEEEKRSSMLDQQLC